MFNKLKATSPEYLESHNVREMELLYNTKYLHLVQMWC